VASGWILDDYGRFYVFCEWLLDNSVFVFPGLWVEPVQAILGTFLWSWIFMCILGGSQWFYVGCEWCCLSSWWVLGGSEWFSVGSGLFLVGSWWVLDGYWVIFWWFCVGSSSFWVVLLGFRVVLDGSGCVLGGFWMFYAWF